jgi:hypothetical protein
VITGIFGFRESTWNVLTDGIAVTTQGKPCAPRSFQITLLLAQTKPSKHINSNISGLCLRYSVTRTREEMCFPIENAFPKSVVLLFASLFGLDAHLLQTQVCFKAAKSSINHTS